MPVDADTPTEEGSGRRPVPGIRDPKMMRALAHPTRIALIEALHLHPSLTATEASKIIGETPTNCAFHLRTLARYGLVEELEEGRSRRRPWRIRDVSLAFSDVPADGEDPQAAAALAEVLIDRWLGRTRAMQSLRHLQSPEWQDVLGGSQGVVVGTPDEIRDLVAQLRGLLDAYAERLKSPSRRPPGSQPIEILVFAQPFIPNGRAGVG